MTQIQQLSSVFRTISGWIDISLCIAIDEIAYIDSKFKQSTTICISIYRKNHSTTWTV